jgi:hypothetical protein
MGKVPVEFLLKIITVVYNEECQVAEKLMTLSTFLSGKLLKMIIPKMFKPNRVNKNLPINILQTSPSIAAKCFLRLSKNRRKYSEIKVHQKLRTS